MGRALEKVNHPRGVLLLANVMVTCQLSRRYINSGRGGAIRHFVQWGEVKETAESSLGGKASDSDLAYGAAGQRRESEEGKDWQPLAGVLYTPGQETGEGKGVGSA